MAGDNLRIRSGEPQCSLCGGDHAVDIAACAGIDKRIKPVEERVTQVQHIGFPKMNVNVRVSMSGRKISKSQFLVIQEELETVFERQLGQCVGWRRGEMHP